MPRRAVSPWLLICMTLAVLAPAALISCGQAAPATPLPLPTATATPNVTPTPLPVPDQGYAAPEGLPPGALLRLGAGAATAAALAPDGSAIAVGTTLGLALLDMDTLSPRWEATSAAPVREVLFSPDGARVIASDSAGLITAWDARDGAYVYAAGGVPHTLARAFTPDGARLVGILSSGDSDDVLVWDARSGAQQAGLIFGDDTFQYGIWDLALAPAGDLAAVTVFDSDDIHLRTLDGGAWAGQLSGAGEAIDAPAFSPDGRWFASAGPGGALLLWDLASGVTEAPALRLAPFMEVASTARVAGLAFSPASDQIAAACGDQVVLAALPGGRLAGRLRASARVIDLFWALDGAALVTLSEDGMLARFDAATGELIARTAVAGFPLRAAAISPDALRVLAGGGPEGGPGALNAWDAASGALLWEQQGLPNPVTALAFSPDGTQAAAALAGLAALRLVDASTGASLPGGGDRADLLDWADDGRLALAAGPLVELRSEHSAPRLALEATPRSLAFAPSGGLLAIGLDGSIGLWDGAGDLRPDAFDRLRGGNIVGSLAWSADGALLAAALAVFHQEGGASAGDVMVWDARTGRALLELDDGTLITTAVSLSPDGRTLLTGSAERTSGRGVVAAWDATTGDPLWRSDAHARAVTAVAWSTDGTRFLSASADGTAILWAWPPP